MPSESELRVALRPESMCRPAKYASPWKGFSAADTVSYDVPRTDQTATAPDIAGIRRGEPGATLSVSPTAGLRGDGERYSEAAKQGRNQWPNKKRPRLDPGPFETRLARRRTSPRPDDDILADRPGSSHAGTAQTHTPSVAAIQQWGPTRVERAAPPTDPYLRWGQDCRLCATDEASVCRFR